MTKDIITGVLVGFIATSVGALIWILFLSPADIETTIKIAYTEKHLGAIVAAGALLNLPALFLFIKQRKYFQARGVIIATFIVAVFVLIQKFS